MTIPASYPSHFYPSQTYPSVLVDSGTPGVVPDLGLGNLIGPVLGQEKHTAHIFDRGGRQRLFSIDDVQVSRFSRVRDDISTGTVFVSPRSRTCAANLANIAVGRHEMVIYRGRSRAWEGPITRMDMTGDRVEIVAHDINHYLSRTIMHRSYDNRYSRTKSKIGPITRRAQVILNNELARKEALSPPVNILPYLDVRTEPETTKTSRLTLQYQSTVWEELDYMAMKLGLDYTAIGRRLIINDVYYSLGRTARLSDKDFHSPLHVTIYGMELATRSAVTDGRGHWAAVGTSKDPFYGEVELLHTAYGEDVLPAGVELTPDEIEALLVAMASQAQRNLAGRYPVPAIVRASENTRLDPRAPITFEQLVPGMRIPLISDRTVIKIAQEQKLDSVRSEWTEDGESIEVSMSPSPGTSPWDATVDMPDLDDKEVSA